MVKAQPPPPWVELSCVGKVSFESGEMARRVADRRRRAGDRFAGQSAYRCPVCSNYHIGQAPRPSRLKRKRVQREWESDNDV